MKSQEWNAKYLVGQKVSLIEDNGAVVKTKTRSIAWQLLSGEHVVMVDGKKAGYMLGRITAR